MAHPTTILQAFNNMTMSYRPDNLMQGNAIRNVQLCVRDLDGVNPDPNFVDGIFGQKTKDAVKIYQSSRGMTPVDGIVGRATRSALWDEFEDMLKTSGYMATRG